MMSTDKENSMNRFSPLSVAESYAETKGSAWREYMNTITKPWLDCQAKIKECVRQIALDTRKNTPKQQGLIIVACETYSAIASAAFANYLSTLMKAYYLECMKQASLDPLTVATIANKAKAQRNAVKETSAKLKKFSKPEPKRVSGPGREGRGERGKK